MRAGKQNGDEDNPQRMQTLIQLHQKNPSLTFFFFYHSISIFFLTLSLYIPPSPLTHLKHPAADLLSQLSRLVPGQISKLVPAGHSGTFPVAVLPSLPPGVIQQAGTTKSRAGLFPSCGSLNSTYQALTNNQRAQKCHCYVNHCFSNTSSHQVKAI